MSSRSARLNSNPCCNARPWQSCMCSCRPATHPTTIPPTLAPAGAVHHPFPEDFPARLHAFERAEAAMFPGMYCCAFCGVCALGGERRSRVCFTTMKPLPHVPCTPYGIANGFLKRHTVADNGDWNVCKACSQSPQQRAARMRRTVFMSPPYVRALLNAHPLYVQMLSLVDVSVNFEARRDGFARGALAAERQLLSSPLISRGHVPEDGSAVPPPVRTLLGINKVVNPHVRKYLTLLEKERPGHGLPLIPEQAVQHITDAARQRAPAVHMDDDAMRLAFSLAAAVDVDPRPPAPGQTFVPGAVTERESLQAVDLETDAQGLAVHPSTDVQLTLELALFAALFPHGRGAFDGAGSFADYLRYRMLCHFSPFTLFKPYLPLMFLIRQTEMLQRSCSSQVLEKDIALYSKQHPGCSSEDVMRHVLKHTVPASMPGTPGWHYNNLMDLLALVERLGMPHLFWTITADEVSKLLCCLRVGTGARVLYTFMDKLCTEPTSAKAWRGT